MKIEQKNNHSANQEKDHQKFHEIRAIYDQSTIRVYQAFSDEIADSALAHGNFTFPSFKKDRMTWIKPSFLWMMYRSNWATKDLNQSRILAINITLDGFEWALKNSCPTRQLKNITKQQWLEKKEETPVRIQWDPERDLFLNPLPYRTIQIGLSKKAVQLYANKWIQSISDLTPLAHKIHQLIKKNKIDEAKELLPLELPYSPQN